MKAEMTLVSDATPATADVVVIGGGIVGCMTALDLATRGAAVTLIEKAAIGTEQSRRNWGYIRQQARSEPEIPLMVAANSFWSSFEDRFDADIRWQQRGNLRLVRDGRELPWYQNWTRMGQDYGVPVKMLSSREAMELLPGAVGNWAGAMYTPNDAQADPLRATLATAAAAARAGAQMITHETVTKILVGHGRVLGVATPTHVVSTPAVIVTAGVWTRRLLQEVGVNIPLQWVRSTVAELAPCEEIPAIPAVWSPEVSFRKTASGGILLAANARSIIDVMPSALNNLRLFLPTLRRNLKTFRIGMGAPAFHDSVSRLTKRYRYRGWEPKPSRRTVAASVAALQDIYPAVAGTPVARTWAGYIDGTPDGLPVMSTVENIAGLVIGSGFSGHGFGLSPASGQVLSDLAISGSANRFDATAFTLSRFNSPSFHPAVSVAH